MSSLAGAIERAHTRPVSRQSSRVLGEPTMRAVAERIGSATVFTALPPETLDRLRAQFQLALDTETLDRLPRIAWDRLPAVLWYGAEPCLAETPSILAGLEAHMAVYPNSRCIKGLMTQYVREFRPGAPAFEAFAAIANRTVATCPDRAGSRWVEANTHLSLFIPSEAPARIAQMLLAQGDDGLRLGDIPIPGWAAAGRLGCATLLALLATIRGRMTDTTVTAKDRGAMLERVAEWVDPGRGGASPSLVLQIALADALLSPWANRPAPGETLRKFIVNLVLEHVGDPRTAVAPWQLPELAVARQILTSWLSLRTIEEFCDIIDATAEQGHWQDRRRFWASYAERGFVSDAWVAYGPRAARRARAMGIGAGAFGKLTEFRDQAHSVLLMKIGSLTIAEFSHNGSCRFYPSATWQPDFYKQEYSDYTLRMKANEKISHHQGWQTRIASLIRSQTGVRSDFEYRYR